MRVIKWLAGIVGMFALIPDKTKALVFCLFMAIIVGVSFLVLGLIVAILRTKDRLVGDSRDHKN